MQRVIRRSLTMALLLLIALSLGGRAPVQAQGGLNALLIGTYAFTVFRSCMQATSINEETKQLLGAGSPRTSVVVGTITFNGDGTGTALGTTTNIFFTATSVGSIPVSTSIFTQTFGYTVGPDGSFVRTNIVTTGTVQTGGSAGENFTITAAGPRMGQILERGQFLGLTDGNEGVEALTFSTIGTRERICIRSGVAGKMPWHTCIACQENSRFE